MDNELTIDLGYRPRPWQRLVHQSRKRFSVLALHRRAGKTECAIMELLDAALRCELPLGHYVYLAPYLKQAKAVAWSRLKFYARQIPGFEVSESELWVRFESNGARIQIVGGDNPDGLRGLRLDGCVLDEVANIRPEVWNEIIQPALSDRKGWALFIGTPHGINLFSEIFFRAMTLPDWYAAAFGVYDTDALDPEEVQRLKRDMPENEFRREMLCDFSAAAEDQLISISLAEEAAQRKLRPDQYHYAARIIGVDVARFGDDRSVIVKRQGLACHEPLVFQGLDNMAFASRVAQEISDWGPDGVFIDIGNGSGVVDRLRQLGFSVTEVNFGGKASQGQYVNKRTEMYWLLKEWLESGGMIPNSQELKQDLASPSYHFNASNQVVLESKDQLKKRLLRSPDLSDALCLTFASPVAPRVQDRRQRGTGKAETEYDLFGRD